MIKDYGLPIFGPVLLIFSSIFYFSTFNDSIFYLSVLGYAIGLAIIWAFLIKRWKQKNAFWWISLAVGIFAFLPIILEIALYIAVGNLLEMVGPLPI